VPAEDGVVVVSWEMGEKTERQDDRVAAARATENDCSW
jgi:hypothetical protein